MIVAHHVQSISSVASELSQIHAPSANVMVQLPTVIVSVSAGVAHTVSV